MSYSEGSSRKYGVSVMEDKGFRKLTESAFLGCMILLFSLLMRRNNGLSCVREIFQKV